MIASRAKDPGKKWETKPNTKSAAYWWYFVLFDFSVFISLHFLPRLLLSDFFLLLAVAFTSLSFFLCLSIWSDGRFLHSFMVLSFVVVVVADRRSYREM